MTRDKLGTSRFCFYCSARFYDLNRISAVCPKCLKENDFSVKPDTEAKPEKKTESEKVSVLDKGESSGKTEDISMKEIDIDENFTDHEEENFLDEEDGLVEKEFAGITKEKNEEEE